MQLAGTDRPYLLSTFKTLLSSLCAFRILPHETVYTVHCRCSESCGCDVNITTPVFVAQKHFYQFSLSAFGVQGVPK